MNPPTACSTPRSRWPRALCAVLLLVFGWSFSAATPVSPDASVLVEHAEFRANADAAWQPVTLPDSWSRRGLAARGRGEYRSQFELAQTPLGMWALRIDRISSSHQLRINGQLIDIGPQEAGDGWPVPQMIEFAPGVLRAGRNDISIAVDYRSRSGLAPLHLGPRAEIAQGYAHYVLLTRTLPECLNVAGVAFGLFMLVIWGNRRSEAPIGWFGALCTLVSVRNCAYFGVDGIGLPVMLSAWLFYAAQVATVVLLGFFASALAGRRWRWFDRTLIGIGAVLPLGMALGSFAFRADQMRAWTYPLIILLSLPALWLLFTQARRVQRRSWFVLGAGLAMVLTAGTHDYFYQQGYISVLDTYWIPFATPVALAIFSQMLVKRLVNALSDVERLNTSLELRVAERTHELEIANAAKTRFLAAASHDMRQPVVTIGLLVGLVREHVAALPPVRAMLDRLHDAVASMEALLQGLMDLSRLESGTVQPRVQAVPLAPLFDAIDLHEQTAAVLKDLRLHFQARELAVLSDPVLLDQIVRNLVSNAVRYTERGGVLVSARRRGRDRVLLQVWDTGRGIEAEAQAAVFEEFVQLDNPGRERSKGLGLGLAIVQRSARLLGHEISLRSVPGRGSCFTLELTLAPQRAALPVPVPVSEQPLREVSVWLIEDDAAVRNALEARLRRWGAHVLPLACRVELQRQIDAATALPALVVSDQRLNDGSGLECIALIRAHAGHALPAVIVTGDTAPADLALLASAGLPVLHKPFSADALLVLLQQALGSVAARS